MFTEDQEHHFRVFGFLVIRKAFSSEEALRITEEAEVTWEKLFGRRLKPGEPVSYATFIEQNPFLFSLIDDDRIYEPMTRLLGSDMIWVGSEGNRGVAGGREAHHWHADRPGTADLGYTRIKIMIYLDPMRRDHGALRVIPGSHRSPFHEALQPFQEAHVLPNPTFFGMRGADVPAQAVETDPGDLVLFNQSLFHAVYGTSEWRRYIALKYAARPVAEAHVASMLRGTPYVFNPDEVLRSSERPRVRRMIEGLVEMGERAGYRKPGPGLPDYRDQTPVHLELV